MKRNIGAVIGLFLMLSASVVFACEGPCCFSNDPCGCDAAQCECSANCELGYKMMTMRCGINLGCWEDASILFGLSEAKCATAWAGCTAGCY
jgi:hypothetical protein